MDVQSPFNSNNVSFFNAVRDRKSSINPIDGDGKITSGISTPKKPSQTMRSETDDLDENIPSSEEENPLSFLMSKLS